MRERFLIWLKPSAPEAVEWLIFDGAGNAIGTPGSGSLAEAAENVNSRQVTLLVPGERILLTHTDLPTRDRKQVLLALPFALEESLASDPDDLHFVPLIGNKDEPVATGVINRSDLAVWIDQLEEVGIQADVLTSEVVTLPHASQNWSIYIDGDRSIVRRGKHAGFVACTDSLSESLDIALRDPDTEAPEQLDVLVFGDTSIEAEAFEKTGIPCRLQTATEPMISMMAHGLKAAPELNLLQGQYGQSQNLAEMLKPWRTAAALFFAWIVLQFGMLIAEEGQLDKEHQALEQEIVQIYRSAFPGSSRIVNARVQMERKLKELKQSGGSDSSGFLELLAISGRELGKFKQLQLKGTQYRNQELTIELTADNLQSLDRFKKALDDTGKLGVELQSASSRDKVVIGRIVIKPKA